MSIWVQNVPENSLSPFTPQLFGFCGLSLYVANLGNRAVYYIRQSWLIETNSPPASSSGARPNGESTVVSHTYVYDRAKTLSFVLLIARKSTEFENESNV